MAHADLTRLNTGNVARACRAGTALLHVLGTDPRIRQAYHDWRLAHQLTAERLRQLRQRRAAATAIPQDLEDARWFHATIHRHKQRDARALARLLRDQLGLRYPWLAPLLLAQFRAWAYTAATGDPFRIRIRPATALLARLPRGRQARHAGADIVRDVRWLYRARLQPARETTWALGKEWAATQQRRTEAHSVVIGGIRRAQRLLAMLVLVQPTAK